jgi:hypothetical protein
VRRAPSLTTLDTPRLLLLGALLVLGPMWMAGGWRMLTRAGDRACQWASAPPAAAALVFAQEGFRTSLEDLIQYGACRAQREPLNDAISACMSLPAPMRSDCVDGVGHGIPAGQVPPEQAVEVLAGLPGPARAQLADGMARSWAEAAGGEPEATTAALTVAGIAPADVINGVRIGLQRSRGHDLPAAIATAARWPSAAWPALFEELGWRAGNDALKDCFTHIELVPPAAQPAFVRGAARGAALKLAQGLSPAQAAAPLNLLLATLSAQRPADGRDLRWGVAAAIQLSRWPPAEKAALLEATGLTEVARERADAVGLGVWAGPEDLPVTPQQPTILR